MSITNLSKEDNNLVFIKIEDVFTDSKIIAENAGVKHHAIQQITSKYISDFEEFGRVRFTFEMRPSKTNQKEKIYLYNEQQATLLLSYLKNTDKVREFKKNLVKQFFKAKKLLEEINTPECQQLRLTAKSSTKTLHETIDNVFIPYAISRGSETYKNKSEVAYTHFEKPINKALGIGKNKRAYLDKKGQTILDMMNNTIMCLIEDLVEKEIDYHEIVNTAKNKIKQITDIFNFGLTT